MTQPRPDASRAIELAYGLLWDTWMPDSSRVGLSIRLARRALLDQLDREGQHRGIKLAQEAMAAAMQCQVTPAAVMPHLPKPATTEQFFALPEGPQFGERIEGRTRTPVARRVIAFFAEPDDIISRIDAEGQRWTLGRYADGGWFRSRGL